jgi:hypothetical protein
MVDTPGVKYFFLTAAQITFMEGKIKQMISFWYFGKEKHTK